MKNIHFSRKVWSKKNILFMIFSCLLSQVYFCRQAIAITLNREYNEKYCDFVCLFCF